MATILFANNASSTLAGPISSSALTANLASGTGALFPSPSGGNYFVGTFTDAATGLINEIVQVTGVSADTITIVRAQEGTIAKSWLAGDNFNNLFTAGQAAAMAQTAQLAPTRIVTTSGAFTMTISDANGHIGLNRSASLATSSATLSSAFVPGNFVFIDDLAKNFQAFPVTVTYPPGTTGPGGAASQVLNVNGQSACFTLYPSNLWMFKP